jgi:hypothetical protein
MAQAPVSQDCVGLSHLTVDVEPIGNRGSPPGVSWTRIWPTFYPGAFRSRNRIRQTNTSVLDFRHPGQQGRGSSHG